MLLWFTATESVTAAYARARHLVKGRTILEHTAVSTTTKRVKSALQNCDSHVIAALLTEVQLELDDSATVAADPSLAAR
jgi:ribosomal protein S20